MKKFKIELLGDPPKEWYHSFSARACINGKEFHCLAGKYSIMILNVHGNKGLKIMKECEPGSLRQDPLSESSRSIDKVKEINRIHELFFEEGIGSKVENEIVEIEFDSETLSNYMPNLPMPLDKKKQRWYGFWMETLVPKSNFFIDLYFKCEKRFAEKINNRGIRRFNIYPAKVINQIVKRCYQTKFHYFVNSLKTVCIRNEFTEMRIIELAHKPQSMSF